MDKKTSVATLGGGCYWCLEAYFQRLNGVISVLSGYSGGHVDNPTTDRVYRGGTGHAEVVYIEFDPQIITFKQLLEIFFVMHDPTTLNRQGNDVGEIYRSVIYYHDVNQKEIAEDVIKNYATDLWNDPIVTELSPYLNFWPADESMQDYYNKNRGAPYCEIIIDPKVKKLRQQFSSKLK